MELKELQEKLAGVYDLTTSIDCQAVIRMLLRDADIIRTEAEAIRKQVNFLAFLVVENSPSVKDTARRILSKNNIKVKSPAEMMDFLMRMGEEDKRAEKLSKEELEEESYKIWGNYNMDSRESAVIGELIQRFKKARAFADEEGPKYEVKKT
jgi:hypothetical protein